MELTKDTLYDWLGTNEWLFRELNAIHGSLYDPAMVFFSRLADRHYLPYYMGIMLVYVLFSYLIRKANNKGGARQYLASWFGVFLVIVVGYATYGKTIGFMKDHFHYPRPYIALEGIYTPNTQPPNVRVTEMQREIENKQDTHPGDEYRSFPSGHASFITFLVVALWPMLTTRGRWLGLLLIPLVCLARIALNMHFPSDVLGGVVVTAIVIIIVRAVVYGALRKIFNLRC